MKGGNFVDSYNTYLEHPAGDVLPVEEALQLYNDLCSTVEKCDCEDLPEFLEAFLNKSCAYATIRTQWEFWDREKKMEKDSLRTTLHNSVIDAVNILARLLNSEGIETPWREQLGDKRKRVGDFACFVAYMVGINNR